MRVTGIDHVQLAMPAGHEDVAREFYSRTLGIAEVPKPPDMAKRGGAWFENGAVKIHLGVEADFRPARKAADGAPGVRRVHVADPFGNRIELIEARAD